MNKVFTKNGWDDYIYWQTEDKKTLKKINKLIEDICRNGNSGLGKPEPLLGDLSGFWSRRINEKDRLVYKIDEQNVYIISCRYLRSLIYEQEVRLTSFFSSPSHYNRDYGSRQAPVPY